MTYFFLIKITCHIKPYNYYMYVSTMEFNYVSNHYIRCRTNTLGFYGKSLINYWQQFNLDFPHHYKNFIFSHHPYKKSYSFSEYHIIIIVLIRKISMIFVYKCPKIRLHISIVLNRSNENYPSKQRQDTNYFCNHVMIDNMKYQVMGY